MSNVQMCLCAECIEFSSQMRSGAVLTANRHGEGQTKSKLVNDTPVCSLTCTLEHTKLYTVIYTATHTGKGSSRREGNAAFLQWNLKQSSLKCTSALVQFTHTFKEHPPTNVLITQCETPITRQPGSTVSCPKCRFPGLHSEALLTQTVITQNAE